MKVFVEYDFYQARDIEIALENIEQLFKDHVKASQCKEKGMAWCGYCRELSTMQFTFENVLKQLEIERQKEYRYKDLDKVKQ